MKEIVYTIKTGSKLFAVIIILLFLQLKPISLVAQPGPVPCDEPYDIGCPDGCKADRMTCWNPDDPVPLDNGLLLLAGAALTFGLYKLHRRKQIHA